jgi:hypothetical protein
MESSIDLCTYDEALKIKNYAVGTRYPDITGDPTDGDVLEAIEVATFFRTFAAEILSLTISPKI